MILKSLQAFNSKSITLGKLIGDLEALIGSFAPTEEYWKVRISKPWAILEDVYADALDKGFERLPDTHTKLIDGAVRELEAVARERMDALSRG